MSDIPLVNYNIPYFNQEDLALGIVSLKINAIVGFLFSTLRSPFDFGVILEQIVQSLGFLNNLIGVSFQLPFSESIFTFLIFALSVTLTVLFYDVSFGKGRRKNNRYFLVFGAMFLFAVPYSLILSLLQGIGNLSISILLLIVVYFAHVTAVKLARIVANR